MNRLDVRSAEFDLHGFVAIRLDDASESDVAAVRRQLGLAEAPLLRDPDIVIRFCDRLPISGPVRLIGAEESAYTSAAWMMLRSKHKSPARAMVPMAQIGGRCEIVCERGLSAVPLLVPIVNLTALAKGYLPLHASAFVYEDAGVLVTGWAKGGKTETLLAFMSRGAEYVGDEWIYIDPDGRTMYGIPEPIKLWDWHLRQIAHGRELGPWDRVRLRAGRSLVDLLGQGAVTRSNLPPLRSMRRVGRLLSQQLYVHVPPRQLFGAATRTSAPIDSVILVGSHASPRVTIESIRGADIAGRMVFSLLYERLDLLAAYLQFRHAFPSASNELLENAEAEQRRLLAAAFDGREAFAVYHPYPLEIATLFDAISPIIRAAPTRAPQPR